MKRLFHGPHAVPTLWISFSDYHDDVNVIRTETFADRTDEHSSTCARYSLVLRQITKRIARNYRRERVNSYGSTINNAFVFSPSKRVVV